MWDLGEERRRRAFSHSVMGESRPYLIRLHHAAREQDRAAAAHDSQNIRSTFPGAKIGRS
jgi:hypothetical protein